MPGRLTGGVLGFAREADTPLKAWELFVTPDMIDEIVISSCVPTRNPDENKSNVSERSTK